MGKDPGGETDQYDFREYNTVVNAFLKGEEIPDDNGTTDS
jgi:hypothetical protein